MMNSQILSDGSNENDLKAVNTESMKSFLGEDEAGLTSFEELYNATVSKVDEIIRNDLLQKQEVAKKAQSKIRTVETDEIVESLLETIDNLPLDAQMRIKHHITGADSTDEEAEQSTNVPIKKAGRPKKVKEGTDK